MKEQPSTKPLPATADPLHKSEEASFRKILNATPVLIGTFDPKGRVLFANQALAKHLNILGNVDNTETEFDAKTDVDKLRGALTRLFATGVEQRIDNLSWPNAQGQQRRFYTILKPLLADCALSVSTDITSLIADNSKKNRIGEERRQAHQMAALRQVLQSIANEFNNFLAVIDSTSQVMQSEVTEQPPLLDMVHDISEACYQARALVWQVMDFCHEEGRQQRADLSTEARRSMFMLQRLLPDTIEMDEAIPEDRLLVGLAPFQITQILVDLVLNARNVLGEQKGAISLVIQNRSEPSQVEIVVTDNGPGLSDIEIARLFEPLTLTQSNGAGPNMAAIMGLMERCGGTINVQSEPGQGSAFRICLPLLEPEPQVPQRVPGWKSSDGVRTLLVVDDQLLVTKVVERILTKIGNYKVLTALNCDETLKLVKEDHTIDAILMDVMMPEMTGARLANVVRSIRPDVPIVHMSASPEGSRQILEAAGSTAPLIHKPFEPEQLLEFLDAVFQELSFDEAT